MFIMGYTSGFTPEYKDETVKLVTSTGRTVAVVARKLGVQESTLAGRSMTSRPGLWLASPARVGWVRPSVPSCCGCAGRTQI